MKAVLVEIPRGYSAQVTDAISSRPALDPIDAVRQWVDAKYGPWIAANSAGEASIVMRSDREFAVEFETDDDAATFVRSIGGRVVE